MSLLKALDQIPRAEELNFESEKNANKLTSSWVELVAPLKFKPIGIWYFSPPAKGKM